MRPVLSRLSLAPLHAIQHRSLIHRARRMVQTSNTAWGSPGTKIRALLSPATEGGENIREDQPSAAVSLLLQLPSGSPGAGGDRFEVTGRVANRGWTRLVQVVRVLAPRPHEMRRRLLCMDVNPNPDLD